MKRRRVRAAAWLAAPCARRPARRAPRRARRASRAGCSPRSCRWRRPTTATPRRASRVTSAAAATPHAVRLSQRCRARIRDQTRASLTTTSTAIAAPSASCASNTQASCGCRPTASACRSRSTTRPTPPDPSPCRGRHRPVYDARPRLAGSLRLGGRSPDRPAGSRRQPRHNAPMPPIELPCERPGLVLRSLAEGDEAELRRIHRHAEVSALVGRPPDELPVGRAGVHAADDRGRRPGRRPDPVLGGDRAQVPPRRRSTCSSTPRYTARGSAPRRCARVVRHLIEDRGHHRITIDPAADNAAAIRGLREGRAFAASE